MKLIYYTSIKKRITLVILLLLQFIINYNLSGEGIKHFQDGKIYFKIKDDAIINIPADLNKTVKISEVSFLRKLERAYGIISVTRPFSINNDTKLLKTYELQFSNYALTESLITELQTYDFIEYAERVPRFQLCYTPNDAYYNSTQGDYNINWYLDKIHASEAWDISKGSSGIKIAIVDNAVWTTHEDLSGKIVAQRDVADGDNDPSPPASGDNNFRQSWTHGTHVAGLAGAKSDNSIGVASIGYNCSLIAVKAAPNSTGYLDYVYNAIDWAANNGADVINMSVGDPSANTVTGQNIINAAAAKGIILIGAAGNDGTNQPWYPAAYSNVISVGSTDDTDYLSTFSQYGSWVNIAAPGGITKSPTQTFEWSLISTTYSTNLIANFCTGYYNAMKGTSMSAPVVSGFCGLVKSLNKSITQAQIKQCLQTTADPLKGGHTIGGGRMNALKALNCLGFYHAPIIDFTSNTQKVTQGNNVQFTDLSTHYPTSWEWTFEGGTPSTSATQNPLIKYSTTGTFQVTLKAYNKGGNNTLTKSSYIQVLKPATQCDSLGFPYTKTLMCSQTGTNNGYIAGTNSYGDKAKANYIDTYTGMTKITGGIFVFGGLTGAGNLEFAVWNNKGTGGAPGTKIASKIVPISSLQQSSGGVVKYNRILFDNPVQIPGPFYMGIILPTNFPTTKVGLMHSKSGEGRPGLGLGWEQLNTSVWQTYKVFYGDIGNLIFPILCPDVISKIPVPEFSANKTTINKGDFVQFTDKSTNEPNAWSWTFDGGKPASSNAQNPIVQYEDAGEFNVSLTATNNDGSNSITKTKYITVLSNKPVAKFISDKTSVQEGGYVQFTDESLNSPSLWAWEFEGGTPESSGDRNPKIQYNKSGTYSVFLKVNNENGKDSIIKDNYITVTNKPKVCDTLHKSGFNGGNAPICCICGTKNGCVSGNNKTGDLAKAEFFNISEPMEITFADIEFGIVKNLSGKSPLITFVVWDNTGTKGSPGSFLSYSSKPITELYDNALAGKATRIYFDPPAVTNGPFYLGVMLPTTKGDTLLMKHSDFNKVPGGIGTAWEMWDNNEWYAINDPITNWSAPPNPLMQISFAIFPYACTFVGIKEKKPQPTLINIYPNPANNLVHIDFGGKYYSNPEIKIFNILGMLQYSYKAGTDTDKFDIDLSDKMLGIYFIRIYSDKKLLTTKKLSLIK